MKVIIIEDEDAAMRRLQKMILEVASDTQILAECDSIESSVVCLQNYPEADLIFMDIHLADGSSFEIFNQTKINKPVIFTTAYDQYAIQAFQVNALDYLLKPVKLSDLERAMQKFRDRQSPVFDYQKIASLLGQQTTPKRFLVRIGNHMKLVDMEQAAYFYSHEKITYLINFEGKRFPLDQTMEEVENMMTSNFFRINRQMIINIKAIKNMTTYSKSRVKLELAPASDQECVVSTEISPLFKKWLTGEK